MSIKIKIPRISEFKLPLSNFSFLYFFSVFVLSSCLLPCQTKKYFLTASAIILTIGVILKKPRLSFYILTAGLIAGGDKFSKISIQVGTLPVYIVESFLFFSIFLLLMRILTTDNNTSLILPHNWRGFIWFFAIGIISLMHGLPIYEDKTFVLRETAFIYYAIFYFIVPQIITNKRHLLLFLKINFLGALIMSLNYVFNKPFEFIGSFEYFYSGMALIYLWLVAGTINSKILRTVSYASMLPFFVIFVSGEARAAWVGLMATLTWLLILVRRKLLNVGLLWWVIHKIIFAAFISMLVATLFFPKKLFNIYREILTLTPYNDIYSSQLLSDNNVKWRIYVWEDIISESLEKPILGWGFGKKFTPQTIKKLGWGGSWREPDKAFQAPHNSLLTLFHNTGILGLCIFISIILIFFRHASQILPSLNDIFLKRVYIASTLSVLYILFTSFFMVILEGPYMGTFLWINMGVAAAIEHINSRAISGEEPQQ